MRVRRVEVSTAGVRRAIVLSVTTERSTPLEAHNPRLGAHCDCVDDTHVRLDLNWDEAQRLLSALVFAGVDLPRIER